MKCVTRGGDHMELLCTSIEILTKIYKEEGTQERWLHAYVFVVY